MGMFECSAVGCSDEVPGEGNGLTVVVEYETDLEGGAYEVGVAPEGSPGLERLVSEARGEADALVGDEGGWAAVRPRRFSGDVSRHPRTPARQGAATPWNLA